METTLRFMRNEEPPREVVLDLANRILLGQQVELSAIGTLQASHALRLIRWVNEHFKKTDAGIMMASVPYICLTILGGKPFHATRLFLFDVEKGGLSDEALEYLTESADRTLVAPDGEGDGTPEEGG